jgi:hypothetical protein
LLGEPFTNVSKSGEKYGKYRKNYIRGVGPKVSGLTYKSRAKWKMLRGIYSAIYGEVNVSISVCVEIRGDYIEK